jgi:hypothetical protein
VNGLEHARRRLSEKPRARRWAEFLRRFPDLPSMRVLDLGGSLRAWEAAPTRPKHVTIVNLDNRISGAPADWYDVRHDNACDPGPGLLDERFDLVYSNSLIEHVGGHAMRRQLADVIRAAAPMHWVQTPYRYFPIEPHWLVPGMQFLPLAARSAIARRWPFGPASRATQAGHVVNEVAFVELVPLTEMRDYFPGSQIWIERAAGLPKSLVAVKSC